MDKGWQCVYTDTQLYKVEIVQAVLKDNDIESVVVDKRDSNYTMIGEIEIYVPNTDAILAKIIIDQNSL
jgi:hypothetical protein